MSRREEIVIIAKNAVVIVAMFALFIGALYVFQ